MKKLLRKIGLASEKEVDEIAKQIASEKLESFMKSEDFDELLVDKAKKLIRDEKRKQIEKQEQEKRERQERVEKAKENIETYSDYMREKDEPYVHIRAIEFDPEHGIKIDIDWNRAFIKYLNANGIKSSSDEETVRLWLAHLSNDISAIASVEQYMTTDSVETKPDESILEQYYIETEDEDESDN